ncbi:MAG: rhodanese-like domain-containing protein [Chthoniobacterales bacterium]
MIAELSPRMTMQELLQVLPGAQRALFRLFHIGGCSSCGFRPDETFAEVCARNEGLDPDSALSQVNDACAEDAKMLIEPADLASALAADPDTRVLDIRTREEFDAVHIPQARHFTQEFLQEIMGGWPKDSLIALVDHQGTRGLDAAAFFAGHGFTNVRALRGGIDAWSLEVDSDLPRYTLE